MAVALAFLLNLNRVAVLLGVLNLPWIIGAHYASTTVLGATILRTSSAPGFRDRLADLFEPRSSRAGSGASSPGC